MQNVVTLRTKGPQVGVYSEQEEDHAEHSTVSSNAPSDMQQNKNFSDLVAAAKIEANALAECDGDGHRVAQPTEDGGSGREDGTRNCNVGRNLRLISFRAGDGREALNAATKPVDSSGELLP